MRQTSRATVAADPPAPPPVGAGRAGARAGGLGTVLLLGTLLSAACGQPAQPVPSATSWTAGATAAPTTAAAPAPAATPSATPSPVPSPGSPPAAGAAPDPADAIWLPWPAPDAAAATQLQKSVDGGAEPWLLDPAEVAVSYASAAHGWTRAQAQPQPGGTTVEVTEGGRRLTLTLRQPARTGPGGIWVVTGETGG